MFTIAHLDLVLSLFIVKLTDIKKNQYRALEINRKKESLSLLTVSFIGTYSFPRSFAFTKGQIILKANYLVLNSSQKRTKYLPNSALATKGQKFLVRFLEELRTSKFAFEII